MKKSILAFSAFAAATAVASEPRISSVSIDFNAGNRLATIRYTLSDAPGIITLDVQTNRTGAATAVEEDWVSIGGRHLSEVSGDVNRYVEESGEHVVLWRPDGSWPDQTVAAGAIRAAVTAWSPLTPPDYLVVDLEYADERRYYQDEDFLPRGGLTNDYYRQNAIVMRKIPAAGVKWTMGAAEEGFLGGTFNARRHYVRLSEDYYIGVFELTIGQVKHFVDPVMRDGYIQSFSNTDDGKSVVSYQYNLRFSGGDTNNCPIGDMRHDFLRTSSVLAGFNWPAARHWVSPQSFLGKMRARTGVDFDLPTEAQWEFAARAGIGTMTQLGDFTRDKSTREANLFPVAWYDETVGGSTTGELRRVGTKLHNGFGLYDMLGNMDECCLDWYDVDYGIGDIDVEKHVFSDPEGPATGTDRSYRGGYCRYSYETMYLASRHPRQLWYGTRLMCPVGLVFPESEKSTPAADE